MAFSFSTLFGSLNGFAPRRNPELMLITDHRSSSRDLAHIAREALEGGVTSVMLREKELPEQALRRLGFILRQMTREMNAALIINHHIDLALEVEADAVHLGWRSKTVESARRVVGERCKIGFSAHTLEEAQRAVNEGADYLTYSPIFDTPSKAGLVDTVGLEGLREITKRFPQTPIIALGGITEKNAAQCIESGSKGVAGIRCLYAAQDVREAAQRLRKAISR